MRLTKLELNGFKSFAKKTELVFDEGITAVIGPNGSGKSNIADAVRWVLGEQSAKALRGAKMEDIIFNGTQERRPQAYCEVMLTFDNSDGTLPIEFAEVTVTRRVYRSGDSEYAINRNACRLKDVYELFRDTGIGKEGYSIIGQGRVDEILSNKSGDRRIALEEAAGVMRYRVRKEEALRKLEHTRKNLERLEDILSELNTQRDPLREQAEKARVYLAYRDELKDLELNVFLHQYERLKDRLDNAAAAVKQLEEESTLQLDTEKELAAACLEQEEALHAIEKSAMELQNNLLSELSTMEAHAGEASVFRERKENIVREQQRFEQEREVGAQKCAQLYEALEQLVDHDTDGQDTQKALDEEIAGSEANLMSVQQAIAVQEETLEAQKNSIIDQLNRLSDAKSQLSRMEAMTSALHDRQNAILLEKEKVDVEHQGLLQELNEAENEWENEAQAYSALIKRQEETQKTLLESREAFAARANEMREMESALGAAHSRLNVLEEMSRAHEGYYASVRNLLKDCDFDVDLKRAVLGVVAEIVQVPREYETAVEMTLGSSLQNIVTPTPEHAKRAIDHLRNKQYGRATFLPISAMRPRLLNQEERVCLGMPGCIGVASELVNYAPQYKNVVDNLLGRTVIVETLEAGIALNKRSGAAFRIATLQGDIIHPGGSMTGGSVQKREFSLLGREREIKQLRDDIVRMQAQIEQKKADMQQAGHIVQDCKQMLADIETSIHERDVENARYKEKLDLIHRDIGQNEQKVERMELEYAQIEDNLADIEKERQGIQRVQSGIEDGNAATQEDVALSQKKLNALREEGERISQQLTERKVQHMALQKEKDAFLQERKRLSREIEQAEHTIEVAKLAYMKAQEQESALEQQIIAMAETIAIEQKRVDVHKEQQHAIEEERQKRTLAISEAHVRKDELNARIRELDDKKHRQELNFSRAELEFASMQERIMTDYELTYEQATPFRKQEFGVTNAHVRIDELRKGVRELGNINVNAVEDYAILNERCEMLTVQCTDLTRAEADLNTLIDELTATMEKQFMSKFKLIQEYFAATFEQLFDGGYAELRLSDAKDPLNCDIDIIAQPPGKKLQLLTLLSGGERALTAIALLFAMLKLKPTVFCILDEIETSLDEVNVTRFANYLKRYSDQTQFILITHRKGSMEVCNTLYGVAMEEKGISRLVSARFQPDETAEATA